VTTVLSSRQLRRILIAYTVNRLGTWFGLIALAVAVFDHTHSGLSVAALLFAGEALPALVVPAVVARVEASRRGSALSGLYFLEALVTAVLAILIGDFWLPAVLVLVALDGTAALAASALLRAEVARVARAEVESADEPAPMGSAAGSAAAAYTADRAARANEAERSANAALNTAFSTTFVIGPALGGAVVAAAGARAALLVDVGSFLLGGALLIDLRARVDDAVGDSVRARLRGAWRHINEEPRLRWLLLAEVLALTFIQTGGPIEVTYVKATLRAGDRGLGLLLTSWGAGSVIGSVLFARLVRRPLAWLLSGGSIGIALGYFGLALAPSLALACVAGLVGGIGNAMQWPSLISAVQRLTPQYLHGRLMAAVESIGALCLAIGLPLGGVLVALTSPRTAFLIVGAGAALATTGFLRVRVEGEVAHGPAIADDGATGPAAAADGAPAPFGEASLR
jgi:MFS family permease